MFNLRDDALRVWDELTIGMQSKWASAMASMSKAFATFQAFLAGKWTGVSGDAAESWNLIRHQAQRALNATRASVDDSFDIDAANRENDANFVARQQDDQQERKTLLSAIDSNFSDSTEATDAALKTKQDELAAKLDKARVDRLAARETGDQAATAELESMIAAFEGKLASVKKAAEAAKRTAAQTEGAGGGGGEPSAKTSNLIDQITSAVNGFRSGGAGDRVEQSARGTFNPAAISLALGIDDKLAKRTADAAEQTADNTEEIVKKMDSLATPTFA